MKYKTTDKEQRENNALVLGFGYCQIQNIEKYLTPRAYTCGVYGWRADFYEFAGFTISTGYAPLDYIYKEIHSKKTAEKIKAEILKLEKDLENRRYAWQKTGNWDKGREFINKKINAIYKKTIEAEYTQKNGNK